MANFNKVILAGNLTRDPQLSYLPNNTPVVEFGMAINRKWKAQDGQMKEEVCFVDIRAFARTAETINQYLRKGNPILIDGRLRYDQWEAKDGAKRSRLTVVAENFQFLSGPAGGGQGGGGSANRPAASNRGGEGYGRGPASAEESQEYQEMPPVQEEAPAGPSGDHIPF